MLNYGKIVALTLALMMSLGTCTTAVTHAKLVSSNPMDGAQLGQPPAWIILVFSEVLDGEQSSFTIMDAKGHIRGHFLFIDVIHGSLMPRLHDLVPPDGLRSRTELTRLLAGAGFRIERWKGVPVLAHVVVWKG